MAVLAHWVNGEYGAGLDAADRGFAYGDGVFETFRCHHGHAHLWPYHRDRLLRGLAILGIDCAAERFEAQLQQGLEWLVTENVEQAVGRLAVSRGPGGRGYGGSGGEPTMLLSFGDAPAWREPVAPLEVVICNTRLAIQPRLAGIKHANRLEQVLAARELTALNAAEGLLMNERGEMACAVSSNIFIACQGGLLTPPVSECGVAGTVRRLILEELAPAAGIAATERVLHPADLKAADELFLTNSVHGVRSVSRCEGLFFTSSEQGDNLRELFYAWSESAA